MILYYNPISQMSIPFIYVSKDFTFYSKPEAAPHKAQLSPCPPSQQRKYGKGPPFGGPSACRKTFGEFAAAAAKK